MRNTFLASLVILLALSTTACNAAQSPCLTAAQLESILKDDHTSVEVKLEALESFRAGNCGQK